MQIKKITLREISLELVSPFQISSGTTTARRIIVLEVEDINGATVWSECTAGEHPNYSPENTDTAWYMLKHYLAPQILNKHFERASDIEGVQNNVIKGHLMAKAAIEMATWALEAQLKNISLAKLINATQSKIPCGVSIGIQDSPQALVDKVGEYAQDGYQKIKVKIKKGCDIDYIQAVRDAYTDKLPLMVDANNSYQIEDVNVLKELDAFDLIMIEQPLAWDDIYQHAAVQSVLNTPICLDESITSVEKAAEMVALKSGRIVNIKPGRVGGFSQAIAIHDFCKSHNIPVWCGGMLESGIGRAYNVALAAKENFTLPGDVSPSNRYWKRDIVKPEWQMNNGYIEVPLDKPGLGVEVDTDFIEHITTRKEIIC